MNNVNVFEQATRTKLRFPFKGNATVEDLWDLSVEELDFIFKKLNTDLKLSSEESLLNKKNSADEILEMKITIIKHIVSVKQNEENDRVQARVKKDKKDKILEQLAKRDEAELTDKTRDQLLADLAELG